MRSTKHSSPYAVIEANTSKLTTTKFLLMTLFALIIIISKISAPILECKSFTSYKFKLFFYIYIYQEIFYTVNTVLGCYYLCGKSSNSHAV